MQAKGIESCETVRAFGELKVEELYLWYRYCGQRPDQEPWMVLRVYREKFLGALKV